VCHAGRFWQTTIYGLGNGWAWTGKFEAVSDQQNRGFFKRTQKNIKYFLHLSAGSLSSLPARGCEFRMRQAQRKTIWKKILKDF
jgi:hypothetical protein